MSEDDPRWVETARLAELGLHATALTHEIRQPLFALKGLLQLMLRARPEDANLEQVLAQTLHIERLVDQWTTIGRRPGSMRAPVVLAEVVKAGVLLAGPKSSQVDVPVQFECPEDGSVVLADAAAVQQITLNLTSNALDAARSRVAVRVRGPVLEVTDDGPGIPEPMRDKVIQPFVRMESDRSRKTGGTGLGLAIVSRIMKSHGGSLSVGESSTGGTLVTTRWPTH